jgi:hypothetical protein
MPQMADSHEQRFMPRPPRGWTAKPKNPRGRPSKRTPERCARIIAAILWGNCTLDVAARTNGITYQTLHAWQEEDRSFAAAVERARGIAKSARAAAIKRVEQTRKRQAETTQPASEHSDYEAYCEEYFREVDRIFYAQEKADARARFDAALARHAEKNNWP